MNKVRKTLSYLRIYHALMVLLYTFVLAVSYVYVFNGSASEYESDSTVIIASLADTCLITVDVLLIILHIIGFAFVAKQRKWVWIYQVILIGIGLTSIILIMPCIVLLMMIISDEVKGYYLD